MIRTYLNISHLCVVRRRADARRSGRALRAQPIGPGLFSRFSALLVAALRIIPDSAALHPGYVVQCSPDEAQRNPGAIAKVYLKISLIMVLNCLPVGLSADTTYVIDKLLVGVHQEKDLDSAIIKVLPTGTRLEVLRREGELAYIEDPDQTRGWVDVAYLTIERPAELRVAELERDKTALESRIQTLQQQPSTGAPVIDNTAEVRAAQAQIEALTKENTDLKGKLSGERLRAGKFQSELSALRAEVKQTETPPDVRITELERIRKELGNSLEDATERITKLEAQSSKEDVAALLPMVLEAYATTLLVFVGAIAILAFGIGVYCMDLLIRKRHGGFRV